MNSDEEFEKEITSVVGNLQCPKDFKCYRSGLKTLCKAKRAEGAVTYLECLEDNPQKCVFAKHISGDDFNICSCPLRRYIADKKQSPK